MKLKSRKLLLNLTSLGILCAGGIVLAILLLLPLDSGEEELHITTSVVPSSSQKETSLAAIDPQHSVWKRSWRQPLYDPPPPPKVVEKPRPITVKLIGTVVEAENSQAFVQTASGSVELKRIGDQITGDPADGTIASIASNEITIKRTDGEHQLKVAE